MKKFNQPIIFIKADDAKIIHAANLVIQHLLQNNYPVGLTEETAKIIKCKSIGKVIASDKIKESKIDVLIVIGGDGSLLSAAKAANLHGLPVIGINLGLVGFLTDIMPSELKNLTDILSGKYIQENRNFIAANVKGATHLALNDIALTRFAARLLDFDIFINQKFICSHRADGLIIATPTGSTAYALSAGGPIVHPAVDSLVLVPLCPHKLNSRPIIVDKSSNIDIYFSNIKSKKDTIVSCDGVDVKAFDILQVSIQQSQSCLQLLHPLCYDYFDALKNKLHWEKSPIND